MDEETLGTIGDGLVLLAVVGIVLFGVILVTAGLKSMSHARSPQLGLELVLIGIITVSSPVMLYVMGKAVRSERLKIGRWRP